MPLLLLAAGCHRDDVKVYRIAKDQDQVTRNPRSGAADGYSEPEIAARTPGHFHHARRRAGVRRRRAATDLENAGGLDGSSAERNARRFIQSVRRGRQTGGREHRFRCPAWPARMRPMSTAGAARSACRRRRTMNCKRRRKMSKPAASPRSFTTSPGQNPASGNAERILGVIQHRDGMAWFYKMTGDADLVEQQKPAFVEFLKSLNFGAAAQTQAEMPAAHPAIGGDMVRVVCPRAAPGQFRRKAKPNWQVPAGWQEVPAGQFLVAKFTLTGDGGATAAVNVSSSPGDGGGLARKREPLARPARPGRPALIISVTPVDVTGGKASLVDFSGTDARTSQPARLVGIVVSQSDQTWFYKLMGDAKVVESQKDGLHPVCEEREILKCSRRFSNFSRRSS